MTGPIFFRQLAFALLTWLLIPSAGGADLVEASVERIRIGGSGGPLGGMALLAEAFSQVRPQTRFVVVPSLGSGGGIKALRAGVIDLAVISRPLKATERDPLLTATEYARTPFVFAVGQSTQATTLTIAELVSIYQGERRTWPDGRPLRLVLRPETESDTDILKSLSPEMNQAVKTALARPGMIMALADKASADSLETIPGAFGAITLAQLVSERRALRPLALDGVTPSLTALAQGSYPHHKTFLVVTHANAHPAAREFSLFIRSAAAREILEQNGHWVGSGQ